MFKFFKNVFSKKTKIKVITEEKTLKIDEEKVGQVVEYILGQEIIKHAEPISCERTVYQNNLVLLKLHRMNSDIEYFISYTGFMSEAEEKEYTQGLQKEIKRKSEMTNEC